MRNYIFFFLLLAFQSTQAQVALGIYGGLDQSSFSGDVPRNVAYIFKEGYVGGLICDFSVAKDVFISLRPNFTQNGANVALRNDQFPGPGQLPSDPIDTFFLFPVTNQTLALPVLMQIYVTRGFYANAGMELSYLLSAKSDVFGKDIDIIDQMNKYQVNAMFGFGGSIPIGRTSLNLEITYAQGLNTLTKPEDIDDGSSPRLRSRRFRIAAYFFIFASKEKL